MRYVFNSTELASLAAKYVRARHPEIGNNWSVTWNVDTNEEKRAAGDPETITLVLENVGGEEKR